MGNFALSNNNAGGVQTINFCGDAAGHNYQVFSVDSSSGPDDMAFEDLWMSPHYVLKIFVILYRLFSSNAILCEVMSSCIIPFATSNISYILQLSKWIFQDFKTC